MLDNINMPTNTTDQDQPPDLDLIAAQRTYGICSTPDCDQPILGWCTRCSAKMCARHLRLVQLAPNYRPGTLCHRCEPAANIEEDPATLIIRRPDYDPNEEPISEPHAAWWLACCVHRYLKLAATIAPEMLLDRELAILTSRLEMLRETRQRAAVAQEPQQ